VVFPIPYDQLTLRRLPWVTWAIAALWLGAAALSALAWPEGLWGDAGLRPDDVTPVGVGMHWLLHESGAHLLAALTLLLLAGTALEEAWGRLAFAGFFAVALACGNAVYVVSTGDSPRPLVGASAALAALITAFAHRFHGSDVRYHLVGWWQRPVHTSLRMPAWGIGGVWFACEVCMQLGGQGDGVTRGAHYGGQIAGGALGVLVALAFRRLELERRWLGRLPEGAPHPALAAAVEAREESGPLAAAGILEAAVADHPEDADMVDALCESAIAGGEPSRARAPFTRLARSRLASGDGETAARLWSRWSDALGRPELDPRARIRLAEALRSRGEALEAARQLREVLASEGVTPGLALRVVEAARGIHAGVALTAIERALEASDLHETKRSRLETLRSELVAQQAREPDPELEEPPVEVEVEDRSIEIEPEEDLRLPPQGLPAPTSPEDTQPLELSSDGSLEANPTSPADLSGSTLADTAPILDPVRSAPREPAVAVGLAAAAGFARFSEAKRIEVIPLAWERGRIQLRRGSERTGWFDLSTVEAVAAAGVRGLATRPVVVIDLLLNWTEVEERPLQLLRWRSDHFDPAALRPEVGAGLQAFRGLLDALLEETGAVALPDPASARGRPFQVFESLEAYEREVLSLES